jgi:serine/threonine protein kinase
MASPTPPEAALFLNQTLGGRYKVTAYLNRGGFSLLFRGVDTTSGLDIAIKVLHPGATPDNHLEFEGEATLLRQLKGCSHVVDLHDDGRDHVQVQVLATRAVVPIPVRYQILELAEGDLSDVVANRASISWSERIMLFRNMALGVHQMHLGKVVHRDIKSENGLLFPGPGKSMVLKVADLGRSRDVTLPPRFSPDQYEHGRGDLRFAPPEALWLQVVDAAPSWRRADLYLLGSVLYELATGQGITALALGNPMAVIMSKAQLGVPQRAADYRGRVNELRGKYQTAFDLFANEVPREIEWEARQLLEQLCDPDPSRRGPRFRADLARTDGLEWVLRRSDIILAILRQASKPTPWRPWRRKTRSIP